MEYYLAMLTSMSKKSMERYALYVFESPRWRDSYEYASLVLTKLKEK